MQFKLSRLLNRDYQIFVNSKNYVNRNSDKSYFDFILNLVLYILLKNRKRKLKIDNTL